MKTNSLLINKFISIFMKKGKKVKMEKLFYKLSLKIAKRKISPLHLFALAILNLKPLIELRKVKKKRKIFMVPFPINLSRQISLAIKIIQKSVRNKKNFENILAEELFYCSVNKGICLKNMRQTYHLILRNRIYKHYRWF